MSTKKPQSLPYKTLTETSNAKVSEQSKYTIIDCVRGYVPSNIPTSHGVLLVDYATHEKLQRGGSVDSSDIRICLLTRQSTFNMSDIWANGLGDNRDSKFFDGLSTKEKQTLLDMSEKDYLKGHFKCFQEPYEKMLLHAKDQRKSIIERQHDLSVKALNKFTTEMKKYRPMIEQSLLVDHPIPLSFPKGKNSSRNNSSSFDTAMRELKEETGVDRNLITALEHTIHLLYRDGLVWKFILHLALANDEINFSYDPLDEKMNGEVANIEWYSKKSLEEMKINGKLDHVTQITILNNFDLFTTILNKAFNKQQVFVKPKDNFLQRFPSKVTAKNPFAAIDTDDTNTDTDNEGEGECEDKPRVEPKVAPKLEPKVEPKIEHKVTKVELKAEPKVEPKHMPTPCKNRFTNRVPQPQVRQVPYVPQPHPRQIPYVPQSQVRQVPYLPMYPTMSMYPVQVYPVYPVQVYPTVPMYPVQMYPAMPTMPIPMYPTIQMPTNHLTTMQNIREIEMSYKSTETLIKQHRCRNL